MNFADTLRDRWKPEWAHRADLAKLRGALDAALHFAESVPNRRAELARPGDLSAKGLNEAMRKVAAEKAVPALRRAAWDAEKTTIALNAERRALSVPKPDPADLSGAVLRSEIRAYLRGLDNHGERLASILGEPEFQVAAFEGPAALSGLSPKQRNEIEGLIAEQAQGAALEAIEDGKEAVALVQAAVEVAVNAVRAECGFTDDGTWGEFMHTASAAVEREVAAERAALLAKPSRVESPASSHAGTGEAAERDAAEIRETIDRIFAAHFGPQTAAEGEAA